MSGTGNDTDTTTTPAPTFEELPLEKGAILELHSIDHADFDGLLVEYLETDKDTGKLRVASLKSVGSIEEDQNMLVKTKACRRPAIKSLKLRRTLAKIATDIKVKLNEADNIDLRDLSVLKTLIEKDPCCGPAYLCLFGFETVSAQEYVTKQTGIGSNTSTVRGIHKGLANMYGYQDMVSSSLVEDGKMLLTTVLMSTGHFKLASRWYNRTGQVEESQNESFDSMVLRANHECSAGVSMTKTAKKYRDERKHAKASKNLLRSSRTSRKIF